LETTFNQEQRVRPTSFVSRALSHSNCGLAQRSGV